MCVWSEWYLKIWKRSTAVPFWMSPVSRPNWAVISTTKTGRLRKLILDQSLTMSCKLHWDTDFFPHLLGTPLHATNSIASKCLAIVLQPHILSEGEVKDPGTQEPWIRSPFTGFIERADGKQVIFPHLGLERPPSRAAGGYRHHIKNTKSSSYRIHSGSHYSGVLRKE